MVERELQGNRWDVMDSIIPLADWAEVLCKMINRWLWLDGEQVTTWTSPDVICTSVSPGTTTFSCLVN